MSILNSLFGSTSSPSALLSKARKAERIGDDLTALSLYRKISNEHPDSREARQASIDARELANKNSGIGPQRYLPNHHAEPGTTVAVDSSAQQPVASEPAASTHYSASNSPLTGEHQPAAKWFWAMICFTGAIFLWVCGGVLMVVLGQEFLSSQGQFGNEDSDLFITFLVTYAVVVTVAGYWASRSNLMFLYMLATGSHTGVTHTPGSGLAFQHC